MDYKYLLTLSGYIIFRYPMDKVSAKVAKEMYEHALKLETDFKHLISGKFAFFTDVHDTHISFALIYSTCY